MNFPYKIAAFDMDGTLSPSKSEVSEQIAEKIFELARHIKVAVISGGSIKQFEKQILKNIRLVTGGIDAKKDVKNVDSILENIILLPVCGTQQFFYDSKKRDWVRKFCEKFPDELKQKVRKAITDIVAKHAVEYEFPKNPSGDFIEDRETQITFSALGQEAEFHEKAKWDPDQKKKIAIRDELAKILPELEIRVGGTTSIDILPKGYDKAVGVTNLLMRIFINESKMIFVGDAIFPGGNDEPVKKIGIKSVRVSGPDDTLKVLNEWLTDLKHKSNQNIFGMEKDPVAFFSMEYGFQDETIPYAGGLGILSADFLYEAGDQNFPFVAVGLRYAKTKLSENFELLKKGDLPVKVNIPILGHKVTVCAWVRQFAKDHVPASSNTSLILLDTDLPENEEKFRNILNDIYTSDGEAFLIQQIILGLAGVAMIKKIGLSPVMYHLNEGHTAFAALGILAEELHQKKASIKDLIKQMSQKIVGTKHTILSASGSEIPRDFFEKLLGAYCDEHNISIDELLHIENGTALPDNSFSTTRFLINVAGLENGVSVLHTVFEKKRHPESSLIPITNGVYQKRWQSELWDLESSTLSKELTSKQIRDNKRILRQDLVDLVKEETGTELSPDVLTLVWARRLAKYKRPDLLFSQPDKLLKILRNKKTPIQIIISGKAHPADSFGQQMVLNIKNFIAENKLKSKLVYMPNYNPQTAWNLVSGADVWLNTPERGMEACGTSGMKAALNGTLQCTVSDGWADEVNWQNIGWTLPDADTNTTANALFEILSKEIIPDFYEFQNNKSDSLENNSLSEEVGSWAYRMKKTIEIVEQNYTATRMLDDYKRKLYRLS